MSSAPAAPAPLLALFDIDGTLLRGATEAHRDAVHQALRDVYGIPDPGAAPVAPAGRTDREIARQILLGSGVGAERIDEGIEAFRVACGEHFARLCPDTLAQFVIDGVPQLLAELSRDPRVRLALVTGNLEPIARLKLARAGIGQHFVGGQGAFGSDAEDRSDLPGIARRRAGGPDGPHPRGRTLVIGDTPRDIACARADGVRVLAVATGPYRPDELRDADAVASDTTHLAALLAAEL